MWQKFNDSFDGTYLFRILQFFSTPLYASVRCHQDDKLSAGRVLDLKSLCIECLLQGLNADEVLKLEIPGCGPTLTELLDEALEAKADSLTCQEIAVLDLSSHVLWQKGLIAERDGTDFCMSKSIYVIYRTRNHAQTMRLNINVANVYIFSKRNYKKVK